MLLSYMPTISLVLLYYLGIVVGDPMFLGMQDFDLFFPNIIKFYPNLPQFFLKFAQICILRP